MYGEYRIGTPRKNTVVLYATPTLRPVSISSSRTRMNQSSRGTGHEVYSAW